MNFDNRYIRTLILVSSLFLLGSTAIKCSTDESDDSSGGSTGTRVRVSDEQKISSESGSFSGNLDNEDQFGSAVADLDDLEADGVRDIVTGAPFDDDDGSDKGAIWNLFMDTDGRVDMHQKVSGETGGFGGDLGTEDWFGSAVTGIGDLNGDGVFDAVVGAPGGDDGGPERGEIWVLFLTAEGKAQEWQRIADDGGGFDGDLDDDDRFGSAVADIGDINGDGVRDLAVGAPNDDDGSDNAGAIWILMMNADGRVGGRQKISQTAGRLDGSLSADDNFGAAITGIGDLDGDGTPDLAVGAPGGDDGGTDRGEVWILFLDVEGKVQDKQRIADGGGGFDGDLNDGDRFGTAVADIGDINDDGIRDLAVGVPNDDDGSDNAGAVWILTMEVGGRVDGRQKISKDAGGFNGNLSKDDYFGTAIAGIGDLDNNGVPDLAVGAPGDDDGGTDKGAVWVLFMSREN
jgi:hypothetical protein